jgi:hypothetical protein
LNQRDRAPRLQLGGANFTELGTRASGVRRKQRCVALDSARRVERNKRITFAKAQNTKQVMGLIRIEVTNAGRKRSKRDTDARRHVTIAIAA